MRVERHTLRSRLAGGHIGQMMPATAAVKGAQRAAGRTLDGGGRRRHSFTFHDRRATSPFHMAFFTATCHRRSRPLDIGSLPDQSPVGRGPLSDGSEAAHEGDPIPRHCLRTPPFRPPSMERAPSLRPGFPERHRYIWTRPTPDRASAWLSASALYRPYSPGQDRTLPA
jgi:hypothetical protein